MKTRIQVITMALLTFLIVLSAQAQYILKSYAFSNGGAASSAAPGYNLQSVAGQTLIGFNNNTQNALNSGFIAGVFALHSDDPLPVELVHFSATTPGDSVILISFITASETNAAGFNILCCEEEHGNYRIIANYINNDALLSFGNSSTGGEYAWKDRSARPGMEYWYKLQNIDIDGNSEMFGPVYARLKELPQKFRLAQNYPNPFNPATTINYELPKEGRVKIEIFNVLGQKVTSLLKKTMPAGYHTIDFQAENLPSGLYFYAIQSGPWRKVKKMMLVK